MRRREFLALAGGAVLSAAGQPSIHVHEHVMVDFIGGDVGYDRNEVFRIARPRLEEIKALGCRRLQECTPNFLGRDPELLARLSDAVGIEIWSNTGLYGAANHKYVPAFARTETAEQLARRWIAESKEKWRPRFIKIGVNKGPLDELDRKLVRAAAITSRETGLTIASHTGDGAAALEQLELVDPKKFVWVHAQSERDHSIHEKAARAGAWVEFDGIGPRSIDWHLDCVRFMQSKNLLGRTLISHDAGWYHVGEPNGGDFRPFTLLYREFLPKLEANTAKTLLWDNPRVAFGR
jgi:phosphotriesterase-related protein